MWRAWLLVVVSTLIAAPARAGDTAAAEALFREGKRLLEAGKVDQACPKFAASMEAEPSVGAMLNLARCHQQQGKTATAWSEYNKAADMARRAGQEARARGARDLAADLEDELSRLTIVVPDAAEGLVVRRNGERVPAASFGIAVPVDPASYTIEAEAPGREPWSEVVVVQSDGDSRTIEIPTLPPAEDPSAEAPGERPSEGVDVGLVAGGVIAGVGVAALALGIGLGVKAMQDTDALDARCEVRQSCPGSVAEAADIRPIADGATAAIVIGAVALAAGTTLMLIPIGDEAEAQLVPDLGPERAALGLRLRF